MAQVAYREALAWARDPLSLVAVWRASGHAYEKQSEHPPARQAYDMAREIRRETWGESLALAESLHDLGRWARRMGELDSARGYHERALEIRRKLAPGSLPVAASLYGLGAVSYKLGNLVEAADLYERALEIRRELAPDSLDLAATLAGLGGVAYDSGELGTAADYFFRALKIKRELAPASLTLANSLYGLGSIAFERGELERAADYYQQTLEIRRKLAPGSLEEASSQVGLGMVAARRGELESAADLYRQGLEIYQGLAPRSLHVAFALNNLGLVAQRRGELESAADFYRRSLTIKEENSPGSLWSAYTLNDLAGVAAGRGELAEAAEYFERSLEIEQKIAPQSLLVAFTLHGLGEVALNRGEPAAAASYLNRALVIRRRLAPESSLVAESTHALGTLYRVQDQPRKAADLFLASIEALDRQIGQLGGSHDVQAGFRARFGHYYRDAIGQLLELGQPEEAFHVSERARARSFLALLAERDAVFATDVPEELDEARRRLAVLYDRTQQRLVDLSPEGQAESVEGLLSELRRLRRESDRIAGEIRRASPRLADLRYPRPLSLEEARRALDPGTVMLAYSVGENRTDLFVVTREKGLEVEVLATGEEGLRREVELFRHRIREARSSSFGAGPRALGGRLYRTLVEPAEDVVRESDRILLVPDGPLHRLPFAALLRETRGDEEYLVEWKPLHSVLSATVYAELKKARRPAAGLPPPITLAAFGDPLFPAGATRAVEVGVRAAVTRGFEFSPLPYTREEVRRVAALFDRARAYLGPEATEERAKSVGRETRILHFATHGRLDDDLPLNSFLALTVPEVFSEDRDNGLLQVWEIFERLRLDADLVVLSACESGLGQEQGGDGLIGLTRAFQYAGARSVAATLWSVDDPTTTELMARFYRHLKEGQPHDMALHEAQIELIRGPLEVKQDGRRVAKDASAPYYWAAFQIYGVGR